MATQMVKWDDINLAVEEASAPTKFYITPSILVRFPLFSFLYISSAGDANECKNELEELLFKSDKLLLVPYRLKNIMTKDV